MKSTLFALIFIYGSTLSLCSAWLSFDPFPPLEPDEDEISRSKVSAENLHLKIWRTGKSSVAASTYRVRRSNFPIRVLPPTKREAIEIQKGGGTFVQKFLLYCRRYKVVD